MDGEEWEGRSRRSRVKIDDIRYEEDEGADMTSEIKEKCFKGVDCKW